ncbi:Carbamoyl-phosphate synthase [Recurvomyces mirabilis]|uniref:Pyrimidine-specific carbamoyl phosphate synthase-aspartate carbamoyl transferase n=1 Tax=Recurvomyces mirabilis TaxID=574656 RepID=A0AAE0WTX6_9PEZI|nr:Carbamoyl-phosphate synthase [Recurvomyces mirabilis]KAK5160531.1 Carbamoyl-phosphate synthase [Recurvomyces mirabilis]
MAEQETESMMALEVKDGNEAVRFCEGQSFGAHRSVAGELVFQTGMVGYPESITDPSYRGQILVVTFPLVGNYGVPSREERDPILKDLPAHFEAAEIHIAGLIVSTYAGESYSHHLAESSLGKWLKEQNVPAICGVDTRALTKRIREQGSMLGRLLMQNGTEHVPESMPTGAMTPIGTMTPARTPMPQPNLHAVSGRLAVNGSNGTNGNGANGGYFASKKLKEVPTFEEVEWYNPNIRNLVMDVSTSKPKVYSPSASSALHHPSGRPVRVVCVDVGLKYNQLRCLVTRGVEVEVVPWDYDFPKLAGKEYDGLFISNGPGDPAMMADTVKHIRSAMDEARTPIFGICLGHQLLARAAGADTLKMKFGNRGHNIPCTSLLSGKCYITSQNHGFAVDANTLPNGWSELFVNANDQSNEGIRHVSRPYFSVQFHPESAPGPRDTEFLFDVFIKTIMNAVEDPKIMQRPVSFPGGDAAENAALRPKLSPKKVLVLGSGGLSIGQAGEFDYSGSQAIKALKEEGIYTILINPNIATIQTSKGLADKVYFLPVNAEFVRKVIKHERPDSIYVTFGGQTALQVGIQLKDEFEDLGVEVLGTSIDTIITTEDRELFARSMESIGAPCAKSKSASNVQEALEAVEGIGYPVIIRAAYALGGLGSGFAENKEQLLDLCGKAFAASPQILIERSMKGWKEIEYEVVRDAHDNCITVCNMENFDPLGIHTGDSVVVAPSQTLSDEDYNMLRTTAVRVIRHLGVVGECNIQYALNPDSREYCIIEVNARLSRSSALASKATGYPLAFIAAKLGLNIPLNEIKNTVTKKTVACFEPSLDYVVVKIPRWDLKKFTRVSTLLGSSMKSVGEVMAIGRTFEDAIQKAIRSVDPSNLGFNETPALMSIDIDTELQTPSDQRMFALANAMFNGYSVDKIWEMTKIDKWFLYRLKGLSDFRKSMTDLVSKYHVDDIPHALFKRAKELGFSDKQLATFLDSNEQHVRRARLEHGIMPFVKQIDTVAAEFPAYTNYLYTTFNGSEHDVTFEDQGVMVLGSGVYRIGSSVEFDWCSVRAVRTLRDAGMKTVMVNFNPETVSTDYDEADRLYFENITLETILDIYQLERSSGVILSMGGQIPNNISLPLYRSNVKIYGTSPEMIDTAENRYKFSRMLDRLGVDQPAWKELTSVEEARAFCNRVGYPVLVRPSYVLSGAAMNTTYSEHDLGAYLAQAAEVSKDHPVVITKYIENAKEIEMDAVARNGTMIGHFVSEHVENAGVHSGDATLILPPQDLDPETVRKIEDATRKIGDALNVTGPYNIQFIAKDNEIKVIECNVRASRSFPFVSKVMGLDLIAMATKAMTGIPVREYPPLNVPSDYVAVKVPQFSFSRLSGADPVMGVEMASTGEVACFGRTKYEAYIKGLISTGFKLPKKNVLLSIGSYKDKVEMLPSVEKLHKMGYKLYATAGTADFLEEHGISVQFLEALQDEDQRQEYSLTHALANNLIDLYINLPSSNKFRRPANYMSKGYRTRRMAVDYQTPLVTNVKIAKILIEGISRNYDFNISKVDYMTFADVPTTETAAIVPQPLPSQTLDDLLKQSPLKGQDIVSVKQFSKDDLHLIFTVAAEMRLGVQRDGCLDVLKGCVLCLMFFEPSTRTSSSFDAAMKRLGGQCVMINESHSSTRKGESLEDTIRTLDQYGDAIVLRHPDNDSAEVAAKAAGHPIINAGNGSREHPTQALLDLFTIREELGTVNGLTITFTGDLRYGRTVHSLCEILKHYDVTIQLAAAPSLALPTKVRSALESRGQLGAESDRLTPEMVAKTDVLYCTRVQKERFEDPELYETVKDQMVVNAKTLRDAKKNMIVMHPLPRNMELSKEVDDDPRAAYFRQMRYGPSQHLLLPDKISSFCRAQGFQAFDTGPPERRVYDLFLLSTELDWLEIRLHTLSPFVDFFVIVEARTTFTGLPKPAFLEENWERFAPFHNKIIHRVVEDPGTSIGLQTWNHEDYLRTSLFMKTFPDLVDTWQSPRWGDVLIVSDMDEIPKPETLVVLRKCDFPDRLTLRSHFYYYSFQWLHRGEQWPHPQVTIYKGLHETILPSELRNGLTRTHGWLYRNYFRSWWQKADFWNAAWHCSSCFSTVKEMQAKMSSFSHTPLNTAENRDVKTMIERVRTGQDLFGRQHEIYDKVKDNRDLPAYIQQNRERFGYLVDRDGSNAAFIDADPKEYPLLVTKSES